MARVAEYASLKGMGRDEIDKQLWGKNNAAVKEINLPATEEDEEEDHQSRPLRAIKGTPGLNEGMSPKETSPPP